MANQTQMLDQILKAVEPFQMLAGDVYRIVETQEVAATTSLVDDLDEQDLLEQLLDEVKPPYREGTQQRHYLISTPFRYPPLQYGSRFGDITIPSYFYASVQRDTCLAECAYYRLLFLQDMSVAYPKPLKSDHMTFSVRIKSDSVADLTQVTDSHIKARLESASDYSLTQKLGAQLCQVRGANVIKFFSARQLKGINVAISEPSAIVSRTPENNLNWMCHSTRQKISFVTKGERPISFNEGQFWVEGELPRPA